METFVRLPYGGPGAGFQVSELVSYIRRTGGDYIIQAQQHCTLEAHTKPQSLDFWLRTGFTARHDTAQAVNEVMDALEATGLLKIAEHLPWPDNGRKVKGLRLLDPPT
jgi:hypothetical protein